MTDGPREVDRVGDLREVLTATGAGLYLANHVAGPIPAETMAAVHESDELELRIGRAGPDRDDDLQQREKEARAVVAATLKASPEDVALTGGAAEGIRLALLEMAPSASGSDRRRVLREPMLGAGVNAAIDGVAGALGWAVEVVDRAPDVIAGDVIAVVSAHVDLDGRRNVPARTAASARAAGAWSIIDASLSIGTRPLDVADLGADVVVADCHRWLLAPEGTGFMWVGPAFAGAAGRLRDSVGQFGRGRLLGLARSVGWLLMYVELPWVITRTMELADRLIEGLWDIDGVTLQAIGDHGALAAFAIEDWSAPEAAEELSRGVFAIVEVDEARDVVRASVGAWNRETEIDRFIERVTELAAHTPKTLPRKPSLTVISDQDAG